MGNPYKAQVIDDNTKIRVDGTINYTDATNQPGVVSLENVYQSALGVQSYNYPLLSTNSSAAAPTSQVIYALGVPYRAGQVVTRIGFGIQQVGSSTPPTGIFVGLCSTTTMLMDSANQASAAVWTTSTGLFTVPLTAPYTIPTDGIYYHLLLENGTWGGTQLQFFRCTNQVPNQIDGAGPFIFGTIGTGQTALPAINAAVTFATTSATNFQTFST